MLKEQVVDTEPKAIVNAKAVMKLEEEESTPKTLIALAVNKGVSVEVLEKLLTLQERWEANQAKKLFDEAMANFQKECPVISKGKKVDFTSKRTGSRTTYSYAPLDEIVRQVKDLVAKNGLSYTIATENDPNKLVSIVKVRHIAGHAEETRFEVPIDKDSYMSAQQQYGAASTFGKRYAFCNAFGILTGDEDTDAVDGGESGDKIQKAKEFILKSIKNSDLGSLIQLRKIIVDSKKKYTPEEKKGFLQMVDVEIAKLKAKK